MTKATKLRYYKSVSSSEFFGNMKKSIFVFFFLSLIFPVFVFAQAETGAPPVQQDEFFRGKVTTVVQESEKVEFGETNIVQYIKVEILEGPEKGKSVEFLYEINEDKKERKLHDGQKIVLGRSYTSNEQPYYVSDLYRLDSIWFIFAFFFLLTIVLAQMKGFRAFLGLVFSFFIISLFIVPLILKGWDPLWVCLVGAVGISSVTLYIAHGFHIRTSIAFVSMMITLALAAFLSYVFVISSKLFGLGTEEAFFLQTAPEVVINLRGLLLGGILVGTLGVLDDIATAQAATVEQIHKANTSLGFSELYNRGISVGKEHIVSLVNTLVLAYTGASFPLVLLFSLYKKPIWTTLNSEMIAEEIIRMLVGSIALMIAVPLSTFLAAYIFSRGQKK